jgi:hypothetical protein
MKWYRAGDKQVFRLYGYAGTGKTTLARDFAAGVDGEVAFAAFTGKAAHVMRGKGCVNATTIHGLIYRLEKEDENGNPIFVINLDSFARHTRLIIIDEASMVNEKIGRDLLRFRVPIVVIGDPAQLPPVEGAGFFTTGEPDFMLTEIHRQARDSPIIKMATIVREGGRLEVGDYGDGSRVVHQNDYKAVPCDQILVGRNVSTPACASSTAGAAPTRSAATSSCAFATIIGGDFSTAACGSWSRLSRHLTTARSCSASHPRTAALPLQPRRTPASSIIARYPTLAST